MAEAPVFDYRRVLLPAGVILVVSFSALFFLFRGCVPVMTQRGGYVVIYSNLELKDAANVIARLKEIAIPYEIRENGRAIAVPKDKSDQARLGLAEKNLPMGGVVGWEIFDESRLGATDFDRRIQLIRAISGELSRTIRRIEGVEDVRVQIVIPETKLFAATAAPVTGSVMLRLRPGVELGSEKITGIVHLVASSVENLQPENVTVIDDTGKILTAKGLAPAPSPTGGTVALIATPETTAASAEVVLKKPSTAEALTVQASVSAEATPEVMALTAEEKILLKAQAKKELEQDFSGKAQELLNRFYPPNSVIVKISIDVQPAKTEEIQAKDIKIKKINAVVLVDNKIDLTPKLKQATFTTVAAAVSYNKKRGDKIILQLVPFHLAVPPPETFEVVAAPKPRSLRNEILLASARSFIWIGSAAIIVLAVIYAFRSIRRRREEARVAVMEREEPLRAPPRERISMLDQVKNMAERNPERIAQLLRSWLSE
jgi:flagellar M-ring protein FliF